ncbi:MAG: hypothetical protein IT494_09600 [Gammaproteobacteria bacterium]|nr:hypothetical protein [Gammaproteobacteria bacterium]
MPSTSRQIVAQALSAALTDDPRLQAMLDLLHRRHGEAIAAILLYGSYLRGQHDAMLDFYVLLDRYTGALPSRWQAAGNWLLPPNVYHLRSGTGDGDPAAGMAKCATVRLDQFRRGIERGFHPYFWARFAQPCRLLYVRDEGVREQVIDCVHAAVARFIRRALPLVPEQFDAAALWIAGLRHTYASELRAEQANRPQQLYRAQAAHFDALTAALLPALAPQVVPLVAGSYQLTLPATRRAAAKLGWSARQVLGKVLSVARLIKGALTFHQPLEYVLWKIERHSGVAAEPTPLQRRFPLLFGWILLWRIRRRGGFR